MTDTISSYSDHEAVDREAASGRHRDVIGGMWEQLGKLQLDWLVQRGLEPGMSFLDLGCGCLRAGVHLVRYLDRGNYFGVDVNESLLDAGWERELSAGLREKLPRANLVCSGDFDLGGVERRFDMAIAQSLFTHLPLNHLRLSLERLADRFVAGGELYVTFFECPADHPTGTPIDHTPGGIRTTGYSDPYHYRLGDLEFAAAALPWRVEYIGDWGHPRAQRLVLFRRDSTD